MPEMFITQTRSENKMQPDAIMIVICSVLWSGDFVIVTTLVYYFLQFLLLFLRLLIDWLVVHVTLPDVISQFLQNPCLKMLFVFDLFH